MAQGCWAAVQAALANGCAPAVSGLARELVLAMQAALTDTCVRVDVAAAEARKGLNHTSGFVALWADTLCCGCHAGSPSRNPRPCSAVAATGARRGLHHSCCLLGLWL